MYIHIDSLKHRMDKYYEEILDKMESKISELEIKIGCTFQKNEAIIKIILLSISKLKSFVLKHGFKEANEEINFFKNLKPTIVSKLIYYNAIYKIETKKPYGEKAVRKYFNKELKKLTRFFDNNIDFYKYYRNNHSFLDEKMFIRGEYDIKLGLDTHYFQSDDSFSTSHDYKVAKLIANDLIKVYIENQLKGICQKRNPDIFVLEWTASKTALTELVYALYSKGVFNSGNTDIKLIARTFEDTFNICLGDFYHTFMELKARKINRTKFLDSLSETLIKKMDEKDER